MNGKFGFEFGDQFGLPGGKGAQGIPLLGGEPLLERLKKIKPGPAPQLPGGEMIFERPGGGGGGDT